MGITSQLWGQALRVWRDIVPKPEDRIPVTFATGFNILFPLVPLLFMGYLVRRPNTYLYRLALMPFTIYFILRASFGYNFVNEIYNPYNYGQGLFGLASIGKALEYGLVKKGRFKQREATLGQAQMPAIDQANRTEPTHISALWANKLSSAHSSSTDTSTDSVFREEKPPVAKASPGISSTVPNGSTNDDVGRNPIKSPSDVTNAYSVPPNPDSKLLPVFEETDFEAEIPSSLLQGLLDAIEVTCSCRGIGWDFGEKLYVAPQTRPLERKAFLRHTITSFLATFFLLDVIESFLKVLPGFARPASGSIYFINSPPSLLMEGTFLSPWIQAHPYVATLITRYTVSTGISFLIGVAIIAGFTMCYELITLVCVGTLGQNTESWPPLFDHPWLATSLADFWGKRWHQTLRETFFIFGGYPLQYTAYHLARPFLGAKRAKNFGRVGLVLGTFIASGLFHGLSIYAMGTGGVDHAATWYFTAQGVLLLVERAWRMLTGKRVGGWKGRIWAYCVVVFGIENCVDGWTRRGLASGLIIPPALSPTRLFIFPLILRVFRR